jgi:hypothetical protein
VEVPCISKLNHCLLGASYIEYRRTLIDAVKGLRLRAPFHPTPMQPPREVHLDEVVDGRHRACRSA